MPECTVPTVTAAGDVEPTDLGFEGVTKRTVFVVDGAGTVSDAWVAEAPGVEPDYVEVAISAADA